MPAAPKGHSRGFQRKSVSTVTAANRVTHQFSSLAIQGEIDGLRVNFFVDIGSSMFWRLTTVFDNYKIQISQLNYKKQNCSAIDK